MFVVFSYCSRVLAVSYGSCPMVLLGAPHTRSVRLLVPAESTLGSQTKPILLTAAIAPTALILGAAPPCGSTTTGSTYPELRLARSEGLCRYEAPSPSLATITYNETPPYCIATTSNWSLDPSTIPISNRGLPPTLVFCLTGLGPVVYPVFGTSPAHQGLNGDNPCRENILISPAKPRLRPPRLLQRPYPGVYKRHPSTGLTSPIGRGEADPFSENGVGELLHKTLICSLLGISWAWAWLHLLGRSSILRSSRAQRSSWIFISKLRRFRPFMLSVLFEILIVSSESFLNGSNYRRRDLQFHGPSLQQHPPKLPIIMLGLFSYSPMESEKKRVSTALSFRLPILLPGPLEIHLVSRDIIDGSRAGHFRLRGNLASIGFPPPSSNPFHQGIPTSFQTI